MHRNTDYLPEFEPPKKKMHTDLYKDQVRIIYQNQQNVTINLQKELQKGNAFERSSDSVSFSYYEPGTCSLRQLRETEEKNIKVNELTQLGLSQIDIEFYFEYINHGIEYVRNKYSNHEPEILNNKIAELLKLVNKCPKAIKSIESNLNEIPHPMDDIKELACNFDNASKANNIPVNIKKIRRKARKLQNRLQKQESSVNSPNTVTPSSFERNPSSLWDSTVVPKEHESNQSAKTFTCQKQNRYTIKNGEIVKLDDECENKIGKKFDVTGQVTIDEFIKLPRFSNYEAGVPSNVLYVKNLPRQITVNDLRNIFKDPQALEYNTLGGKMRGQAFITYESVKVATESLRTSNGFIVNNKPVILQFAKSIKQ